jgi:GTP-binding protein LepA
LDYEFYEYQETHVLKLDILINRKPVDAFSQIVVNEHLNNKAHAIVNKLKDLIPRHQFEIPIQAVVGGKILARADIKSFRKDVTKKLYGGDQTRKDKLLDAQKKGKKRMKEFGKVSIPQEAFLKVFKE